MTKFHPPIGTPPAVQYFEPKQLQVDRSYQRGTQSRRSQRLIQAIAEKWDWRLCTPLLVASRDGGLYIIDGQHRWEAAQLRGDIPFLPCAVGNYTGSAEEAALFVAANRHRVRVNPVDMWRAALACRDTATVTIDVLLSDNGLSVAAAPNHYQLKPGELLCTNTLYTALRIHGRDTLAEVLASIGTAFGDQVLTHSGLIVAAILGLFVDRPAGFDPALLGDTLAACPADEWAKHPALEGKLGARSRAFALRKVMLEVMALLGDDEAEAEAA